MGWEPAGENEEAILHRREFEQRVEAQKAQLAKPNGADIPPGSYLDSCKGCSMAKDGDTLTCTHCSSPSSAPNLARLKLSNCPKRQVDNDNGGLACAPEDNEADIPDGGY